MTITQDATAPLVVVVGATGEQGGSVIKALLESDKPYRIRGFTRDPSKPASQDLIKQGVELVAVDPRVGNEKQVSEAFNGASYVFGMTIANIEANKDKEFAEGKLLVDAAEAADVKLLVWSGLPDVAEISKGKYNISFFAAKAEVIRYAQKRGIPIVTVIPASFYSNYLSNAKPRKQADGTYIIANVGGPEAKQWLIDASYDFGLFVRKAIETPGLAGSEIHAFTEVITNAEVAKQLSEGTGKTIKYVELPQEGYMAGVPIPEGFKLALRDMALYIEEFGLHGQTIVEPDKQGLGRNLRTFAEFVKATDWSDILN